MKQINYIVLVLSIFVMGACNDSLLDTDLLDKQTGGNFYRTTTDAEKALVGCYDGLQRAYSDGVAFPVLSEILSDNCFGGTGSSDGFGYQMLDEFKPSVSPSDKSILEGNWKQYYFAIFRCNMLISKLDQISWGGNTSLRNKVESEVKFIRAYLYYDMVRIWGNIPLVIIPTSDNVSQATPDEVYTLIANDLKFAADSMPAVAYTSIAATDYGHVTKWAAEALLARVFLYYTGYYAKIDLVGIVSKAQALAYLEDAILNSKHGLVEEFKNLWPAASVSKYAGEDNKETVFAIKYTYTSDYDGNGDGNHWLVMLGMREQSIYPYGNGWGGCTVNPKLWNAFDVTDTRKTASITSVGGENLKFDKVNNQREYTGFYVKKYTPMSDSAGKSLAEKLGGTNFMIGQYQDYVAIRYSDILLMAAELGSANAQAYFNEVRERAYSSDFIETTVSQNAILAERRLEFAFEGIRYWDLLRQGTATASAAINETGVTVKSGGIDVTKTITFPEDSKGLQQVPWNQITLSNGILVQNWQW